MINLKQLISSTPLKMIFLSSWFKKNGISSKSVYDHKKYGWLDVVGQGVFINGTDFRDKCYTNSNII